MNSIRSMSVSLDCTRVNLFFMNHVGLLDIHIVSASPFRSPFHLHLTIRKDA